MDVSPKYVPITNAEAGDDEKLFEIIAAQLNLGFTPSNCGILPFEHVELRVYKPQPATRVVVIRPPKNELDFTSARVYPQEEEKQQQSQSPPKQPPVLEKRIPVWEKIVSKSLIVGLVPAGCKLEVFSVDIKVVQKRK